MLGGVHILIALHNIQVNGKPGAGRGDGGVAASHQALNEAGIAVPRWPVEWGGKDWTDLQHYIWFDEMQRAGVLAPLPFNANMIGPVIATFGSEELKARFLPPTPTTPGWRRSSATGG